MFDCGVGTKGSVAVPAAPLSVEAVVLLHTPAAQTDRQTDGASVRVGGESLAALLTVSKRNREGGAFSQTRVVLATTLVPAVGLAVAQHLYFWAVFFTFDRRRTR